jgi:hypothetical protein
MAGIDGLLGEFSDNKQNPINDFKDEGLRHCSTPSSAEISGFIAKQKLVGFHESLIVKEALKTTLTP